MKFNDFVVLSSLNAYKYVTTLLTYLQNYIGQLIHNVVKIYMHFIPEMSKYLKEWKVKAYLCFSTFRKANALRLV